jgi:hypothetical protein
MQMSELYRRGIVLPMDQQAQFELETNDVTEHTYVKSLMFDDDKDFLTVWKSGVFDRINTACSSCVDDYEEEAIAPEYLPKIIKIANELQGCGSISYFIVNLQNLCNEAIALKMPLYFIL